MKASEIQALLDEPACTHNTKEKSGCAKPKPGATAGGCSFDGAQIALLPIADVAHMCTARLPVPAPPGITAARALPA
jgi:nitrogenase molybdenum-cofactor synthesis protein NifE